MAAGRKMSSARSGGRVAERRATRAGSDSADLPASAGDLPVGAAPLDVVVSPEEPPRSATYSGRRRTEGTLSPPRCGRKAGKTDRAWRDQWSVTWSAL